MPFRRHWGCRTAIFVVKMKKKLLEINPTERDRRVFVSFNNDSSILSSAEHVKFCVNLPGPSGKAK